ncbi:MAG TPA: hypothetical protein VHA78_06090 [Candidatus Peribacteraceae bacterium]|nr:hypothetical protein [Candidatus Peribacteraceae bacterium]
MTSIISLPTHSYGSKKEGQEDDEEEGRQEAGKEGREEEDGFEEEGDEKEEEINCDIGHYTKPLARGVLFLCGSRLAAQAPHHDMLLLIFSLYLSS